MKIFLFATFILVLSVTQLHAQIGTDLRSTTDVVRIAPPGVLADTVNVWGAVGRTGRFLVPRNSTIPQLLSYSGGPGLGGRFDQGGVFRFFSLPQVEVYVNRFDVNDNKETVKIFTYKYREPFPDGMRNYTLKNGEFVTVHIRTRPSIFEYMTFAASMITSLLGVYFVIDRIFE